MTNQKLTTPSFAISIPLHLLQYIDYLEKQCSVSAILPNLKETTLESVNLKIETQNCDNATVNLRYGNPVPALSEVKRQSSASSSLLVLYRLHDPRHHEHRR